MNIKLLTIQILEKMPRINRWRYKFMVELFELWLCIRGRYNFMQLGRWGSYREDSYRKHFGRSFDWLEMGVTLAQTYLSESRVIVFDPSYLPKSGKHTPGLGKYYSGCAGRALTGLELGGLSVVDLVDKTALHLEAVQTLASEGESLVDFYARMIIQRKEQLQQLSTCLVVDAYFAKTNFVTQMKDAGFEVITRLRKDARLRYLYVGPHPKRRGRKQTYDGRVDGYHLREDQARMCAQADDGSWVAYELTANVMAWKCHAKIVIIHDLDAKGNIQKVRILAATDPTTIGIDVLWTYHLRFQSEYLFRDGKQHSGLTHCQARDEQKIHFHLNTSLMTVSLAKVLHKIQNKDSEHTPFSMANIKLQYQNQDLLNRILVMLPIKPNLTKIQTLTHKIRNIGKIAA